MNNKTKSGKTGYEILVQTPEEAKIYCIDDTGKIIGRCMQKYSHYMSNWELWEDHEGLGEIIGDFKKDKKEKLVFIIENKKTTQAKVLKIQEVDIAEMTSNPYIAGLQRPIFRPGTLN